MSDFSSKNCTVSHKTNYNELVF